MRQIGQDLSYSFLDECELDYETSAILSKRAN